MAAAAGGIDLHSHSIASDGQYSASEVAERAATAGVEVWSLSDHDTVAGQDEGRIAAERLGIRFIAGIELSAFLERREIHLLGHFVDPSNPTLRYFEDFLADRRRVRMLEMAERLGRLGVHIRMPDIERFSGGKTLGRPHLARAIVATGVVSTVKEAFDRFIGEGRPAYVQRHRIEAADAVALVRKAGGTTTVAHPGVNKLERGEVARLAAAGAVGIEVFHPEHNPSVRDKYLRIADEYDLIPTAGSDFHGEVVAPERYLGSVGMPAEDLARLEARRP